MDYEKLVTKTLSAFEGCNTSLSVESLVLQKLIYKNNAQFRSEKLLGGLKQVQKCLKRAEQMNVCCSLRNYKDLCCSNSNHNINKEDNQTFLTCLIKIAAIWFQTTNYCVSTFFHVRQLLEIERFIAKNLFLLALISRIWGIATALSHQCRDLCTSMRNNCQGIDENLVTEICETVIVPEEFLPWLLLKVSEKQDIDTEIKDCIQKYTEVVDEKENKEETPNLNVIQPVTIYPLGMAEDLGEPVTARICLERSPEKPDSQKLNNKDRQKLKNPNSETPNSKRKFKGESGDKGVNGLPHTSAVIEMASKKVKKKKKQFLDLNSVADNGMIPDRKTKKLKLRNIKKQYPSTCENDELRLEDSGNSAAKKKKKEVLGLKNTSGTFKCTDKNIKFLKKKKKKKKKRNVKHGETCDNLESSRVEQDPRTEILDSESEKCTSSMKMKEKSSSVDYNQEDVNMNKQIITKKTNFKNKLKKKKKARMKTDIQTDRESSEEVTPARKNHLKVKLKDTIPDAVLNLNIFAAENNVQAPMFERFSGTFEDKKKKKKNKVSQVDLDLSNAVLNLNIKRAKSKKKKRLKTSLKDKAPVNESELKNRNVMKTQVLTSPLENGNNTCQETKKIKKRKKKRDSEMNVVGSSPAELSPNMKKAKHKKKHRFKKSLKDITPENDLKMNNHKKKMQTSEIEDTMSCQKSLKLKKTLRKNKDSQLSVEFSPVKLNKNLKKAKLGKRREHQGLKH